MSVLEKNLKITTVALVLASILFVGVWFRLYDLGRMAFHHDESMHAYYSFRLFKFGPYAPDVAQEPSRYDPVYHGPFLYHFGALNYLLFGDTNFTARLPFAISGIFMLCLAFGLHRIIGKNGALITVFLLAISPTIVYFSRFTREDIHFATQNFMLVVFSLLYLQSRRPLYFYLASLGLILGYCTKESSYMSGAIFGSFLVLYVLLSWAFALGDEKKAKTILGQVFSTYHQYTKAWAIYGLFSVFMFCYVYSCESWFKVGFAKTPTKVIYLLFALAVSAAVMWILAVARSNFRKYDPMLDERKKAQPYPERFTLDWFNQILNDNKELLLSLCMGAAIYVLLFTRLFSNPKGLWDGMYSYLAYWIGQQEHPRIPGPSNYHIQRIFIYETGLVVFSVIAALYLLYRSILGLATRSSKQEIDGKPVAQLFTPPPAYAVFALYWTVTSLIIYSQLNEKVPWLMTHQVLPMALLVGWFCGEMWDKLRGNVILNIVRSVLIVVFAFFMIFAIRSTVVLNCYQNDDPKEQMVYVQSQHDVVEIVKEIDEIAQFTTKRKDLKVHLSGKAPWPFSWYMRNYPKTNFGDVPANVDSDVIIIDASDKDKFKATLAGGYDKGRTYKLQGWWVTQSDKLMTGGINSWFPKFWKYFVYREPWDKKGFGSWDIMVYLKNDIYGASEQSGPTFQPGEKRPPSRASILKVWGAEGTSTGQFKKPRGIAVGINDSAVYVADSENHRVQKFSIDGEFQTTWGVYGTGTSQFNQPSGIAVGPDGNVYVTDLWNSRVQKFDANGNYISQWEAGDGNFFGPRGIVVSAKNEVYVTDTGNKRVLVYTADGQLLRKWGSGGKAQGMFDEPVGIALNSSGEVYVADTVNQRIQVFDEQGKFIRQWTVNGWDDDRYCQPYLALDAQRNVFCTDASQSLVRRYLPGGDDVALYGGKGSGEGQLTGGTGIALDSVGNVYISDTQNNRIQKWATLRHYQ